MKSQKIKSFRDTCIVQAWQWFESMGEINGIKHGVDQYIDGKRIRKYYLNTSWNGNLLVEDGDYIITDSSGYSTVMNSKKFHEKYK